MAELQEYAAQDPPPPDAASVKKTVAYLGACNSLFERGILGKRVFIKNMKCPIIANIESGYSYFSKWLDEHLDKGKHQDNKLLPLPCM